MPFLRSVVRRKVISPSCEDLVHRIPNMDPSQIANAHIETLEDGTIIISWLEPLKDWRYGLMQFARILGFWAGFIILSGWFWIVGLACVMVVFG